MPFVIGENLVGVEVRTRAADARENISEMGDLRTRLRTRNRFRPDHGADELSPDRPETP